LKVEQVDMAPSEINAYLIIINSWPSYCFALPKNQDLERNYIDYK